jgi:predicted DNA-binding transcriptional regulator AlpA
MTKKVVRRILRKPMAAERTGYSAAHLCYLERRGLFPKRVRLQPHGAVGWFEDEVDAWLEVRAAERDRAAVPGCNRTALARHDG